VRCEATNLLYLAKPPTRKSPHSSQILPQIGLPPPFVPSPRRTRKCSWFAHPAPPHRCWSSWESCSFRLLPAFRSLPTVVPIKDTSHKCSFLSPHAPNTDYFADKNLHRLTIEIATLPVNITAASLCPGPLLPSPPPNTKNPQREKISTRLFDPSQIVL